MMAAVTPIVPPAAGPPHKGARWHDIARVAAIAAIALVFAALLYTHTEWFRDPSRLKGEVLSYGVWGPLAFVILYAVGPSFLVPGAVMTIAGGLAFGSLWGAVYSMLGADIGAMVAFGAGRLLGKGFVERIIGERFEKLLARIARNGFHIILYLRIVPVIPYNALNLLAGASPIEFRDYFIASMLGMIPGTILFAFLGDALWHPLSPRFFIALTLILASLGCGEIYRRRSTVRIEID
jgi:uncharacterized membrane protein YdjX (TVP38/TMEM64 family)